MAGGLYHIKVWGDYACFTRPEFKAERVTYPVMTPSAARGVLEAVMFKPEMRWEIREIRVLNPVHQLTILRNEIKDKQGIKPLAIEDQRQQRMSMILKDVAYVITAQLALRPHADAPLAKYCEQFERRLLRGQCYHTPYLGTREFAADFAEAAGDEPPAALAGELGPLLFDIAYREDPQRAQLSFRRQDQQGMRIVRGYAQSLFFTPELPQHPTERGLKLGIIQVPPRLYRKLDQLEGRDVQGIA
jgi:CRISPR-associated protein Cas5d